MAEPSFGQSNAIAFSSDLASLMRQFTILTKALWEIFTHLANQHQHSSDLIQLKFNKLVIMVREQLGDQEVPFQRNLGPRHGVYA